MLNHCFIEGIPRLNEKFGLKFVCSYVLCLRCGMCCLILISQLYPFTTILVRLRLEERNPHVCHFCNPAEML